MKKIAALALLPLILASLQANAYMVHENGSTAELGSVGDNTFSFLDKFVAMDFSVGSETLLDGLTFNAITKASTLTPTVQVALYNNATGSVGTELFRGTFAIDLIEITGIFGSDIQRSYSLTLSDWLLGPGDYWIALQADPAQFAMHWTRIGTVGLDGMIGDEIGTSGGYTVPTNDTYFLLTGHDPIVPPPTPAAEPSAILLFSLGIAGLGIARRKRNKPHLSAHSDG